MLNFQNALFCVFINFIITSSVVILAESGTKTQIISPVFTRASIATEFTQYSLYQIAFAPNATWIWYGPGDNCGCAMNITIQHFFKLKCLISNISLYIFVDNYYSVYINGVKIGQSNNNSFIENYTINTSNNACDDIFNLTIYAQNRGLDCCYNNSAALIYVIISDNCTGSLCSCNNLVESICSPTICNNCPVNYILDQTNNIFKPNPLIQELSCSVCGIGFYLNMQTNYCNFCSANCLTCNDTSYCLSCNSSGGKYLDPTNHSCLICQLGNYIDQSTNLCNPCFQNCFTCNSVSYCLSCNISAGFYLNITSNFCTQCQQYIGYYINQSFNLCMPCTNNCTIYQKSSWNCICDICNNSLSSRIIAGISVGVILFVAILILIIYFYLRSKKQPEPIKFLQNKINESDKNIQINYSKNPKNCAICLGDNCDLITPCQHQFHIGCFNQWINKNICCPICHDKNIQIVKITMCKKRQIYEHFEISKRMIQKVQSSRKEYLNHVCSIQRTNKILLIDFVNDSQKNK